MATIDNNNLPKGVTLINPGKYLVTNSKGQSRTVYSDTATQLNQYNDSWQTGKPTTITGIVNPSDGRIMPPMQFNPADIIGQEQATNEYFANYTALRKADLVPNKDGTYSSKTTGEKLTDAEIQQKIAAAGLPPNTLEIQKNNGKFNPVPSSESVEASTAALNNVSNIPSGAQPAPAAPLSGTSNSPLTVNSQLGATIVKEEPNLVQNAEAPAAAPLAAAPAAVAETAAAPAAAEPPVAQKQLPASNVDLNAGEAGTLQPLPVAKKQVQDNDPEGNANVREQQNAAANEEAIRNGQESVNLNPQGISTGKAEALNSGQDFKPVPDWRVRLSLAPGANYLYKVGSGAAGILNPLQETEGVIFPYTPAISVAYAANYTPFDPTHSNYKIYQYTNSSVDAFSITCDFTAQDTTEANYLLAVIHFFKSITKMFYGQDQNPKPGTPPPLCYLSGLGEFQFDNHPLAITGFTYQLPIDVDYIRALPQPAISGAGQASTVSTQRGVTNDIYSKGVEFSKGSSTGKPTYVPTKMQISITAHPIVSRNNISNKFSLKEYATGQLLLGKSRKSGGIW